MVFFKHSGKTVLSFPGQIDSIVLDRRVWLLFEPGIQKGNVVLVTATERWTSLYPHKSTRERVGVCPTSVKA